MITYESLFILATTGFALMGLCVCIDRCDFRHAVLAHARAKRLGYIANGYHKAARMVLHVGMTPERRALVDRYIDLLEQAHYALGLEPTTQFDRLRQALIRNNLWLRVVV